MIRTMLTLHRWPVSPRPFRFTAVRITTGYVCPRQTARTPHPVHPDSMEAMLRRNPAKRAELAQELRDCGSPSRYAN